MRFKSILRVLNEAPEDNIPDGLPSLDDKEEQPSQEDALNGKVDFGDLPDVDTQNDEDTKFDDQLFYKMSGHSYVKLYDHDPSSPDNPVTLVRMNKADLTTLSNTQRENLAKHNLEDKSGITGTYKDEGAQRIVHLLDFIKTLAKRKK
jgi:hypothetical protein